MAGLVQDCFSIGSTVACTTCYNQNYEGEVLAFDQQTKMLILKCSSASNTSKLNDVYILNLALCSDVQVKKEVNSIPDPPQSLNLQRLSTRVRNQVEQKKRQVSALAAGVSQEGQSLFLAIARTINQISWQGPNIVVFQDVTITPPYKVENVNGPPESRQLTHVKKIVEKHLNDQASATSNLTSATVSAK
ncbi:LSM12 homolog A [Aedes albopictus]|uniref:AD domain-containing protein n=1 Tax=Aedes albopictus TaxID=7160 RepID=A0ABM2A1Q0_AEDAL|nr:LSM12 homolog A isoform X2 [Aedes albopictus]